MYDDPFEDLVALALQKQRERGFDPPFEVGDLVRFPHGFQWNRERDYVVAIIYSDGFEVHPVDDLVPPIPKQGLYDADAKRLGIIHSPNQPKREQR